MRLLHVGASILNQTPLDWDGNRQNIVSAIDEARAGGVQLLCLPELCLPGYGCEDAFLSPGLQETALEVLAEIVPETGGITVSVGLPIRHSSGLFNCACLIANGEIRGFVAKRHLAGEGVYYEPRWFRPWPVGVRAEVTLEGTPYPLGDIHFDCGGILVGFEICEDAWVADRPGRELARQGVDVILNPSASHFAFGKLEVRKRFALEGSRAFGVTYVYANLLGNDAGRIIYDGGALIASGGKLLAAGPRFSFADRVLTSAVVDIDTNRMRRSNPPRNATSEACVPVDVQLEECAPRTTESQTAAWEESPDLKCEEFSRAVSLGLYDYLRKSRSRGFVVSLSGGADSAGVSVLVAIMAELGVGEIGVEAFVSKLDYLSEVQKAESPRGVVGCLLTCVYQSTRNSSETTRGAAGCVAEAIGARFIELDVDAQVQGYIDLVQEALGRELTWEDDDLALQNIQARTRSPGVWLITNVTGSLLLATSNRSEAAVGYATMDGDTSGGLSPIAGIDKAFLREWLDWMERTGPEGGQAIAALLAVNDQDPSAELRPLSAHQTDETDLMPYPVLDAIERAAIRDRHSPIETFEVMQAHFPLYDDSQMGQWVERFFRLWCRNQWKRERYAPSFHLDDENLDPKTWCRFPILSGGFERELEVLRGRLDGGS